MRRRLLALVPVGVLLVALLWVRLPYLAEGPGPARDVVPLIEVSGAPRFESDGRLILTSVSLSQVTALELLGAWLDPDVAVVPESAFVFPGETDEDADRRSVSEMDQSKIDASVVVLQRLTQYPREHGEGVLIESVAEGCPAHGELFPGDLIASIDGEAVEEVPDLGRIIRASDPGRALSLEVRAGGETHDVELVPAECDDSGDRKIGVAAVNNFPFELTISSGDIGGPSAGVMWALGLYDLLTEGDLTGGRTVAGTGVIDLDGSVFPIGGVEQKVIAARASSADVFLVPDLNLEAARTTAGDLELIAVSDFQEALDYLLRSGGESTEPDETEGTG